MKAEVYHHHGGHGGLLWMSGPPGAEAPGREVGSWTTTLKDLSPPLHCKFYNPKELDSANNSTGLRNIPAQSLQLRIQLAHTLIWPLGPCQRTLLGHTWTPDPHNCEVKTGMQDL